MLLFKLSLPKLITHYIYTLYTFVHNTQKNEGLLPNL